MKRRWIRLEPGARENGLAAAVGLGAGAALATVLFYFVRLFLAREEIRPLSARGDREAEALPDRRK